MSSSSQSAPAQRVPAWKRLGLKLKQQPAAEAGGSPAASGSSTPNGAGKQDLGVNAAAPKRKRPEHSTPLTSASPLKKARTHDTAPVAPPALRKQKSVTFTDDTKNPAPVIAAERNGVATPAKKPKGPKGPSKKPKNDQPTADIQPALEYLRTWKTSRDSWKFNKNHQTTLIKRIFDANAIPSADIEAFYDYIQDLKGFTRKRFCETASDVTTQDSTDGKAGFPQGTMEVQAKQAEYDAIIAGILKLGLGAGSKRKCFDEVSFVDQATDAAITQRVIKRMRAEIVLDELSDSDESTNSDALTATTDAAESASSAPEPVPALEDDDSDDEEEEEEAKAVAKELSTQARPRRRKMRTTADDSSSDESSDSDSDSDASSGTDGDEDSDDEDETPAADDDDDTSSSDSSDSSDSESDESDDSSEDEDEAPAKTAPAKRK
ncbi:hypothetical protein HYQ44_017678 [Verticillium longisporum]|nr:hypothetical protein HYQ44_017678 [Verticillium longisporum]